MKKDNAKLLVFGILNACSFIMVILIVIFISLQSLPFMFLLSLFPFTLPDVFLTIPIIIELCLLFVPIKSCIIGIIYGILNSKQERYGLACCILSAVGLMIIVLELAGFWYAGGHV